MDGYPHRGADLDGEGLPGVLIEQGSGWFYKRNQSANNTLASDEELRSTGFWPIGRGIFKIGDKIRG